MTTVTPHQHAAPAVACRFPQATAVNTGRLLRNRREPPDLRGHRLYALRVGCILDVSIDLPRQPGERPCSCRARLLLGSIERRGDCRRAIARKPIVAHELIE